jgi:hypothetical protein
MRETDRGEYVSFAPPPPHALTSPAPNPSSSGRLTEPNAGSRRTPRVSKLTGSPGEAWAGLWTTNAPETW